MLVRIRFAIVAGGLLVLASDWSIERATAQEPASAAAIAPYLDDATVAVVAVDLERLDLPGLAKAANQGVAPDSADRVQAQALFGYLEPVISSLRKAGATDVYAVFSLHDVTRSMPYLLVQTSGANAAAGLAKQLSGATEAERRIGLFASAFVRGNFAVAGNADLEERLDPARVPDRTDGIAEALAIEPEAAIRLIAVVTEDQRRVLNEMLPSLPENLAGLSIRQIAEGSKWVTLAIDLQRSTLSGVIESSDEQSAKAPAAAIPGFVAGVVTLTLDPSRDQRVMNLLRSVTAKSQGHRVTVSTDVPAGQPNTGVVVSLLSRFAPVARDVNIKRSLKQLGLAMHNFHDTYGGFPPSASYDESGKPLLSWRVYLLPFLEENDLYREFHLDEPWDSPHNRMLIDRMPDVFATEHFDLNVEGKTTLLLPAGERTAFHGRQGIAIRDITDGTSNTLMVLDVPRDRAVVWTRPDDFLVDQPDLKLRLFGDRDAAWTTRFDGSAGALPNSISEETLRKLLSYDGGEAITESF